MTKKINGYDSIVDMLNSHDSSLTQKASQSDVQGRGINVKFPPSPLTACKGDGTTDDTSVLQAILNAGYGKVFIPDGTYMINAVNTSGNNDKPNGGLTVPANTILELSPKAVLQAITNNSQTYSIIRVQDVSNVIIRGGTLKGERSTHTVSPLWQASHAYAVNDQVNANGYVLKCVTAGTSGTTSPVGISGSITDGTVTWNYVYSGEWGYGICLNGVTNVSIEDMTIQDCWGDGIFLNAGVASDTTPCQNVKIKGVVSNNNRRQGISIQFADGVYLSSSRFTNTGGTSPQAGLDIEPMSGGVYYAKNIRVSGCEFIGNAGDGIDTNANNVSQVLINNNTLLANKNRGISIYKATDLTFSNNIVQGNTSTGIELNTSTNISVLGNTAIGNTNGIALYAGANTIKNTFVGNTLTNNTSNGIFVSTNSADNVFSENICENNANDGIQLYGSTNNTVSNNIVRNNVGCGIHLMASAAYNRISGNYCRQNQVGGIQLEGTSNYNDINGNTCTENNQVNSGSNNNIHVYQCSYNNIQNNSCRKGATTNKPLRGIYIGDSTCTSNIVMNNDCYLGGTTSGITNNGTTTILGSGNRNNDGTFSTTPN